MKGGQRRDKGAIVYFFKPVGCEGPIKIGCSQWPAERMKSLSVWAPVPLEMIGAVPGTFDDERFLHLCFAKSHSHREWFHASPRLLDAICVILAAGTVAAVRGKLSPEGSIGRSYERMKTPEYRRYRSYSSRIRHASSRLRKQNEFGAWDVPDDIEAILQKWLGSQYRHIEPVPPSEADMARLDAFLANPGEHGVVPSWRLEAA